MPQSTGSATVYVLEREGVTAASARGPDADLVFEARASDGRSCGFTSTAGLRETLTALCESASEITWLGLRDRTRR